MMDWQGSITLPTSTIPSASAPPITGMGTEIVLVKYRQLEHLIFCMSGGAEQMMVVTFTLGGGREDVRISVSEQWNLEWVQMVDHPGHP